MNFHEQTRILKTKIKKSPPTLNLILWKNLRIVKKKLNELTLGWNENQSFT